MIEINSVVKNIIAQKGMEAKRIIDETFLPNGGSVGGHLTLWEAAGKHQGKQN